MLTIIGTVPEDDFPLLHGDVWFRDASVTVEGRSAAVNRGTPALMAAASVVSDVMGTPTVRACLVGDTGLGKGSRDLYSYLASRLSEDASDTLVFHYLQPDVDWHNRVLFAVQEKAIRPTLIADAGFMYAAKMSGQARQYDLFTPDAGELAFLADETAPHPFYTRGFILQNGTNIEEHIKRAYEHDNAARHLLVKGQCDLFADSSGVLGSVDGPSEPAMEAIGGTGDTLTGIASALIHSGMEFRQSCLVAAKANRLAGELCNPTPASQISELIDHIPEALELALKQAGE